MPEGISVTLYDQGYFSAAQPFEAMKTTALAVAAASACAAFAVLVLFASLFVGRQRETVGILRSLGDALGENPSLAHIRRVADRCGCGYPGRCFGARFYRRHDPVGSWRGTKTLYH